MTTPDWITQFPGAVTVIDAQGTILAMNERAAQTFAADGGAQLVGQSVMGCHPEAARRKLQQLLQTQQRNAYTIEKNGVRKLIYQAPWYQDGQFAGLVELSLEIPAEMPHFVRS